MLIYRYWDAQASTLKLCYEPTHYINLSYVYLEVTNYWSIFSWRSFPSILLISCFTSCSRYAASRGGAGVIRTTTTYRNKHINIRGRDSDTPSRSKLCRGAARDRWLLLTAALSCPTPSTTSTVLSRSSPHSVRRPHGVTWAQLPCWSRVLVTSAHCSISTS